MMTEKIGGILFHPSRLNQYKNTNFFKVLLYLLILVILTSIAPIIDTFKFDGYTEGDKKMFEEVYLINFQNIYDYPDCQINNNKLTCENVTEAKEIGNFFNLFTLVVDPNGNLKGSGNNFYIRLTENNIKISNQFVNYMIINYDELPNSWQNIDFKALKESQYPETAYYEVFVSGVNEIRQDYIVMEVVMKLITYFFIILFEIFFYSLLFYLIAGRKIYKYKEVFKVAVFAYTLPVVIGLFFSLMNYQVLNSTLVALIMVIYLHIALFPKEIGKVE